MTKLLDQELQSRLLELAESTRLYAKGSGAIRPPEHFIQNYCAAKLIEDGFIVTAETCARDFRRWFLQPDAPLDDLESFYVDLVIYDPPDEGIPDHAPLRALVEFKIDPDAMSNDVRKTARLLAKIKAHPKDPRHANAFGYVVSAGQMYAHPDALSEQVAKVERLAAEEGHGPMAPPRVFDDPVPGYAQHHGVVIGLPITQSPVGLQAA